MCNGCDVERQETGKAVVMIEGQDTSEQEMRMALTILTAQYSREFILQMLEEVNG